VGMGEGIKRVVNWYSAERIWAKSISTS